MDQRQAMSDFIAALQAQESAQPGPGQNPMGLERSQRFDPRTMPAVPNLQGGQGMILRPPEINDPMAMQPPNQPNMPVIGMDEQAKKQALIRALMGR